MRADSFDAPKHTEMDNHFSSGGINQTERTEMLISIINERQAAVNNIYNYIDKMIVQVTNI